VTIKRCGAPNGGWSASKAGNHFVSWGVGSSWPIPFTSAGLEVQSFRMDKSFFNGTAKASTRQEVKLDFKGLVEKVNMPLREHQDRFISAAVTAVTAFTTKLKGRLYHQLLVGVG